MTDEAIRKKCKYARMSLPKGMRVVWHGGDLQLFSRVRTLSMGGLFISVPDPPSVGTKLRLSFEVPGGNVHAEACSSPIRCARHEKDFFLLGASSSG